MAAGIDHNCCACARKINAYATQRSGCFGEILYGHLERRGDVTVNKIKLATYCDGYHNTTHTRFYDVCDEVAILKRLNHPNIVRYFCTELQDGHIHMATERCEYELSFYVKNRKDFEKLTQQDVMKQLIEGLTYLHAQNIAHRDLCPENILIQFAPYSTSCKYLLKISGFSLAYADDAVTERHRIGKKPEVRFAAPEVKSDVQLDLEGYKAGDVYSTGLLYIYILTNGDYTLLRPDHPIATEAARIIKDMLIGVPVQRPKAWKILKHPALWSNEHKLSFLQVFYELVYKDEDIKTKIETEKIGKIGIKLLWLKQIRDEKIREVIFPKKKDKKDRDDKTSAYDPTRAVDVFRATRNIGVHFEAMDAMKKEAFGHTRCNFASKWLQIFPDLLMYAYDTAEEQVIKQRGIWDPIQSYF